MKKITLSTTVGELIPGGKYCNKTRKLKRCKFLAWDPLDELASPFCAYWGCERSYENDTDKEDFHARACKYDACPKPPCEVKK